MVNKLSHGIVGIILFTVLIGLIVNFYDGVKNSYVPSNETTQFDTGSSDEIDNQNIGEALKNLPILRYLASLSTFTDAIKSGSTTDIIGSLVILMVGGIGALLSIFIVPFMIASILENYYSWIPGYTIQIFLVILIVYIFIAYKKSSTQQGGL